MDEDIISNVRNTINNDGYDPTKITIPNNEKIGSLVCTECNKVKIKYTLCNGSGMIENCIEDCNNKTLHKFIPHEQIRE